MQSIEYWYYGQIILTIMAKYLTKSCINSLCEYYRFIAAQCACACIAKRTVHYYWQFSNYIHTYNAGRVKLLALLLIINLLLQLFSKTNIFANISDNMTTLRQFTCDDLFRFNGINLGNTNCILKCTLHCLYIVQCTYMFYVHTINKLYFYCFTPKTQ